MSDVDRIAHPLIVGAGGFLGSALTARLSRDRQTQTVVAVDRRSEAPSYPSGVRRICADVLGADLAELIDDAGATVVFQLAGSPTVGSAQLDPVGDIARNCSTTVAVLEAAANSEQRPLVVLVSSAAVYGQPVGLPISEATPTAPISTYGISKLAAELYVRHYAQRRGVRTLIARPFSVYGPGQRKLVVHDLTHRALKGERPLRVGAPASTIRDFAFVDDVVDALVELARLAPAEGEAYNICTGRATTLGELAVAIVKFAGFAQEISFADEAPGHDPVAWIGDPARANALGIACDTSLEEGLEATVAWLRTHVEVVR
jgi:UDP-glucose 4-epimerase